MNHRPTRLVCALLCASLLAAPSLAAGPKAAGDAPAGARVELSGDRLTLTASGGGERAALTINGPGGYRLEQRFGAGEPITVDLLGEAASFPTGERLPGATPRTEANSTSPRTVLADGRYRYELVVHDGDRRSQTTDVFFVRDGRAMTRDQMRTQLTAVRRDLTDKEPGDLHVVAQPSLTEQDFIRIQDGANDGSTNLAVYSDVPSATWFALYNKSGLTELRNSFGDIHLNPTNADLFLDASSGHAGIGTATPSDTLHIVEPADTYATIRLQASGGAATELYRGPTGLFICDPGVTCPIVMEQGAPDRNLVLDSSGNVGINTQSPTGTLHIFGNQNQDVFNAIGPNGLTDAFNFGYSGSSFGARSGFFNIRGGAGATGANPAIYFMTNSVERLTVDNQGYLGIHQDGVFANGFNPAHPIEAQQSGARLTAAGVWTNASSRALKENIGPLAAAEAFKALSALEPVRYNYKVDPEDPQVGFIAEDVPELVATPDRKGMAAIEVVALLTKVVQEQQRVVTEQKEALDAQQQLIEALQRRMEALEQQ